VAHGKVLTADLLGLDASSGGPWSVRGPDGALLAVYERHLGDTLKPAVVLAAASQT
jgi:hypothetical protein